MTQLDIVFEDEQWERVLATLKSGSEISAVRLLTLLEGASYDSVEDALQMLAQKNITLTIADLPPVAATGESAARLRLEQELVRTHGIPDALEANDPLRLYLEEIASMPAAGEVTLLAQKLKTGDPDAAQKLVNLMLPQVISTAKTFVGKGVLLLDLIQEASLGLWQGLQSYSGGDIVQTCNWWIHQYLAYAVLRQAMDAGVGQKLKQAMEDYRSVDEQLLIELGRNPTLEEIAEGLHITVEEAQMVAATLENARTMNRVKQPEPEEIPQEEDQAVEDTAYFQMRQRIQELLSGLSEQDVKLLTLRYGLEGGLPLDPAQTALKLGLTAQEVINREAAALAKLRQ